MRLAARIRSRPSAVFSGETKLGGVCGSTRGRRPVSGPVALHRPKPDLPTPCANSATALCQAIDGCKLAYTQSDEISHQITDSLKNKGQVWFNYELQKMCSIAASTATSAFLAAYQAEFGGLPTLLPAFDARFGNLPEAEVVNYRSR